MNEPDARRLIIEALDSARVHAFRDQGLHEIFLRATRDVSLDELELDSLATMELCIALEAKAAVEILPPQLERIGSLNRLVAHLRKHA